ncbi:hypothetical protein KM043_003566 [Ampulex compressa]|nr:hypothetical protein KM043_003566 [Ampulex compressa]
MAPRTSVKPALGAVEKVGRVSDQGLLLVGAGRVGIGCTDRYAERHLRASPGSAILDSRRFFSMPRGLRPARCGEAEPFASGSNGHAIRAAKKEALPFVLMVGDGKRKALGVEDTWVGFLGARGSG